MKCTVVPYVSKAPAYLENFADHSAFRTDPRRSERMTESNVAQVRTSMTADGTDVQLFSMSAEREWFKNGMTCLREVSN